MPVVLDTPATLGRSGVGSLEVGLLNNLGDTGVLGGERQVIELLEQTCGSTRVRLRLFSLPSISRDNKSPARSAERYHDLETLLGSRLDGLFVTGAEPSADDLRNEIFWPELARVVEWAKTGTRSTIWSCLAAHAAVLHLDGLERRPLQRKCTGVCDVVAKAEHPLLTGAGIRLQVCHSRWNGLDESELAAAGYAVLTTGAMGVDCFVRDCGSLFVFLQGHPEYDIGALGREWRRDLARWKSKVAAKPSVPLNYLPHESEAALQAYVAADDASAPPPAIGAPMGWSRDFAVTLMRNWLDLLGASAAEAA